MRKNIYKQNKKRTLSRIPFILVTFNSLTELSLQSSSLDNLENFELGKTKNKTHLLLYFSLLDIKPGHYLLFTLLLILVIQYHIHLSNRYISKYILECTIVPM